MTEEKKRKVFTRQFLIQTFAMLVIITLVTVGINYILFYRALYDFRYDPTIGERYDVDVRLSADLFNGTTVWFDFDHDIDLDFEVYTNDDTGIVKEEYLFALNGHPLVAGEFATVYINFYYEAKVDKNFPYLEAFWRIEDTDGKLLKSAFSYSGDGNPFYVAQSDVSHLMFKDDVPQVLHANVTLYNR